MKGGWKWTLAAYGLAVLLLFLATLGVIVALHGDPLAALRAAWHDSLGSVGGFGQVLNRMTPLLLASLAFSVGFQAGLFNIGMDGQIYTGAILATGLGLLFRRQPPGQWLLLPAVLLAGAVGGALLGLVPAALRVLWGVNEIFSTVMLNFVVLYGVQWLATGPWNDPAAGEAITLPVPRQATLPYLIPRSGAHVGVLLATAVGVLFWWVLRRTVPGYELRAVGVGERAARVGGIGIARMQLLAFLLGGAAAGLGGAIEVAGVHNRLVMGLSPDYGIMAILVAVLGRFQPIALIPVNFAFAVLVAASDSLQRTVGFPAAGVLLLQALVVLVVIGAEALRLRREQRAV